MGVDHGSLVLARERVVQYLDEIVDVIRLGDEAAEAVLAKVGRHPARIRLDAHGSTVTADYSIAGRQPKAAGFSFGRKICIKYFGQIRLTYSHPFVGYRYFHAPFRPERQEVSRFVEDDILSSH